MMKQGVAKGLFYFPLRDQNGKFSKSPLIPELPTFLEVYQRVHGKAPSGPFWKALKMVLDVRGTMSHLIAGPSNMDKQALADFRKGFEGMLSDQAAIAQQQKVIGVAYQHVDYTAANEVVKSAGNLDPQVVQFWKEYIADGAAVLKKIRVQQKAKQQKKQTN